jgi:hypothetical protein
MYYHHFNLKYNIIYSYISKMISVPTYGHQEHIFHNSFNKYTRILVQAKYQKLNGDDLHY